MSRTMPRLETHSVLCIRREGGVAHFPGLASPRRIHCGQCSDAQRQWLQDLLERAAQCPDTEGGADRRRLFIEIEEGESATGTLPVWSLSLDEAQAPEGLVALWRHGEWQV
ncbi:protealysin inhibitor emfourin [Modicisalibacter xianhensis]|nr:protealysin inhibitor emfourin [Halomonas xianhensis]